MDIVEEQEGYRWFDKILHRTKLSDSLLEFFVKTGVVVNLKGRAITEASVVMSNIIQTVNNDLDGIFISSDDKTYRYGTVINGARLNNKCGYTTVMKVFTSLQDCGYVVWNKGYKVSKSKRRNGLVLFSDTLIEIVKSHCEKEVVVKEENLNVVQITDGATNNIREAKRGEKVILNSIVRDMQNYNDFLFKQDVSFREGVELSAWLCRIFKDNLKTHGRLYNIYQKVNYQTLSQLERKSIVINTSNTVELDYKSLHPALLYDTELEVFDGDDMYVPDIDFEMVFGLYDEGITPNYTKILRSLGKQAMLRILNTKSKNVCIASLAKLLKEDRELDEPFRQFPDVLEYEHEVAVALVDAMEQLHHKVNHLFYKESSLTLMFYDSDIIMLVLKKCMDKGIVALPLHDSVCVPEENKDEVIRIMKESYLTYIGEDKHCVVEEK